MIITCTGYYGTGSSAITDLFSEFDHVCSLGEYEYRFLHEPDGISDLEHHIIENNNRHNTSDAIKRFLRYTDNLVKYGYGGYDVFGHRFKEITAQFVEKITELKTNTWWNKDRIDKGRFFCMADRVYSGLRRAVCGEWHSEVRYSLLAGREPSYYTAIDRETFIGYVREYIRALMKEVNTKELPFIMVDQMVPPTNTKRYIDYFDDVRIIVVDRDPRDVYLLEKYRWKWGVIPVKDVDEYVEWYRITRKYAMAEQEDAEHVMRLPFEDLIYRYEETLERLLTFVGTDHKNHLRPRAVFSPEVSRKNTNLKKEYPKEASAIEKIEAELTDHLYDFGGQGAG